MLMTVASLAIYLTQTQSQFPALDRFAASRFSVGQRKFEVVDGTEIRVLKPDGSVKFAIPLPAARDPRPLIINDKWLVAGMQNFNWLKFDEANLYWQFKTRYFMAYDLATGRATKLPRYQVLGFPLALWGSTLWAVAPVSWQSLLKAVRADNYSSLRFHLSRIELPSGAVSRKRVFRVDAKRARSLADLIVGWDPVEYLPFRSEVHGNRIRIFYAEDRWSLTLPEARPKQRSTKARRD
jgi:hypothetical protein